MRIARHGRGPYSAATWFTTVGSVSGTVARAMSRLRVIVAADTVHVGRLSQTRRSCDPPFVDVNEFRLGGMLGEIAQQQPHLGRRHAKGAASMR
jgi:hypothetical protein